MFKKKLQTSSLRLNNNYNTLFNISTSLEPTCANLKSRKISKTTYWKFNISVKTISSSSVLLLFFSK